MPIWLLILIMVVAAYRLTRLIVKDDFPPILWIRDHLVGGWRPLTSDEWKIVRDPEQKRTFPMSDVDHGNGKVASRYLERWRWVPTWLADLLSCPWCASGWVSLALVVAVALTVGVPVPLLVWPAVWGGAALIAAQKWS